jgi:hypothetical protein
MPAIQPDAARIAYKFKGKTVQVPHYFTTGQALNEMEARFAQRQLASVTGNVLSSAITRKVAKMNEANAALPDSAPEGTDPQPGVNVRRLAAPADDGSVPTETIKGKDGTPDVTRPASYNYTESDIDEATAQSMFDAIFTDYEIGANNNRGDGESTVHDPVESIARNMAWEIGVKPLLKDKGFKLNSVTAELKAKLIGQYLDQYPSLRETAKAQFDTARSAPATDLDALIATANAPATTPETPEGSPPDANDGTDGTPPAPVADATEEQPSDTGQGAGSPRRQRQPA